MYEKLYLYCSSNQTETLTLGLMLLINKFVVVGSPVSCEPALGSYEKLNSSEIRNKKTT